MPIFFPEVVSFRLRKSDIEQITKIVKKNSEYDSESHFYRCAVLKAIREEAQE